MDRVKLMGVGLWMKRSALYAFLFSLLIAGGGFGATLYYFDSLGTLGIIYSGSFFSLFFVSFWLSLTLWGHLRAEKSKVWDQVPTSVLTTTAAIFCVLSFVFYFLFDSEKGLEQFSSGVLAFAAAVAAPFAVWRITLTNKQTETAIRQTDIQQQAEYRQSFLAALQLMNDKDINIKIGAIGQLTSLARQDETYYTQVTDLLSKSRWSGLDEKDKSKDKTTRFIVNFIFRALAQLNFNFSGMNLKRIDSSPLLEHLHLVFGDSSTILPAGVSPPDHWPKIKLEAARSVIEWKKWKADPDNYKPPKPPEKK